MLLKASIKNVPYDANIVGGYPPRYFRRRQTQVISHSNILVLKVEYSDQLKMNKKKLEHKLSG